MSTIRRTALLFALSMLLLPCGCLTLEPEESFDNGYFGEAGQGLRKAQPGQGEKWGVNERSRDIESRLGY